MRLNDNNTFIGINPARISSVFSTGSNFPKTQGESPVFFLSVEKAS